MHQRLYLCVYFSTALSFTAIVVPNSPKKIANQLIFNKFGFNESATHFFIYLILLAEFPFFIRFFICCVTNISIQNIKSAYHIEICNLDEFTFLSTSNIRIYLCEQTKNPHYRMSEFTYSHFP